MAYLAYRLAYLIGLLGLLLAYANGLCLAYMYNINLHLAYHMAYRVWPTWPISGLGQMVTIWPTCIYKFAFGLPYGLPCVGLLYGLPVDMFAFGRLYGLPIYPCLCLAHYIP